MLALFDGQPFARLLATAAMRIPADHCLLNASIYSVLTDCDHRIINETNTDL